MRLAHSHGLAVLTAHGVPAAGVATDLEHQGLVPSMRPRDHLHVVTDRQGVVRYLHGALPSFVRLFVTHWAPACIRRRPKSLQVGLTGRSPSRQAGRVLSRRLLLEHCLALPGAWSDEPWEGDVVAKVGDKIFAFPGDSAVGLKCGRSRDEADEWLRRYPDDATVMAYIGRFGWNTLALGGAIPDEEILEAVDASYAECVGPAAQGQAPIRRR